MFNAYWQNDRPRRFYAPRFFSNRNVGGQAFQQGYAPAVQQQQGPKPRKGKKQDRKARKQRRIERISKAGKFTGGDCEPGAHKLPADFANLPGPLGHRWRVGTYTSRDGKTREFTIALRYVGYSVVNEPNHNKNSFMLICQSECYGEDVFATIGRTLDASGLPDITNLYPANFYDGVKSAGNLSRAAVTTMDN